MKTSPRKPGYALATMLILLGVALFSATASLSVAALESKISRSQKDGITAYYTAEAGVEDALWKLNNNTTYSSGIAANTFQPTPNTYTLANIGGDTTKTATVSILSTAAGYATITVTGKADNGTYVAQRVVEATVFQGVTGATSAVGTNAFMTGGTLSVTNNSTTMVIRGGDFYAGGGTTINLNSGGRLDLGTGYVRTSGSFSTNNAGAITSGGIVTSAPAQTPPGVNFANYRASGGYTVKYDLSISAQQTAFRNAITSSAGLPGPITLVTGNLTTNSWAANKTMKINGLLVVDGSFTSNANGSTIQVIDPGTGKSGILVNGNANITKGTYTVNGVIYTSGSMSVNNSDTMTITGAIVSGGAVNFNTGVALTLTLDTPRATAVFGGTTGTYTSAISHWEEEY